MRLKSLTFLCFILNFITACADSSWIENVSDCTINLHEEVTQLPLTPPCTVATNSNEEIQTRSIGNKKIAIILGSPVSKEKASQWNMKESDLCSTESIGVQLGDQNEPIAISKPATNSSLCPKLHIDQVFFMSYRWET